MATTSLRSRKRRLGHASRYDLSSSDEESNLDDESVVCSSVSSGISTNSAASSSELQRGRRGMRKAPMLNARRNTRAKTRTTTPVGRSLRKRQPVLKTDHVTSDSDDSFEDTDQNKSADNVTNLRKKPSTRKKTSSKIQSTRTAKINKNQRTIKASKVAAHGSNEEESSDDDTSKPLFDVVQIGSFEIKPWYFSPYPEKLCNNAERLYICDCCFKYSVSGTAHSRHLTKCGVVEPPGILMYSDDDGYQIFQVDGRENRGYCQNLCLFCKLFLDSKTLYYDVDSFRFYILVIDGTAVGYFSKEKDPSRNATYLNNLSCILTFPQYQGKGYGKFLISVSYELSKKEGKVGGPEKPLSSFGAASYKSYWRNVVLEELLNMAQIARYAQSGERQVLNGRSARVSRNRKPFSNSGLDEDLTLEMKPRVEQDNLEDVAFLPMGHKPDWFSLKDLSKQLCVYPMDIVDTLIESKLLIKHEGRTVLYLRRPVIRKHCNQMTKVKLCDGAQLVLPST